VRLLPKTDDGRQIPAYGHPEAAAAAVACAARYGAWRAAPRGVVPKLADIKGDDARTLVREFLVTGGGWLPPEVTATLLRCYGIPPAELVPVRSEDAAAAFADGGRIPVVLKADVPGLVHKTDAGGVELDLRTEADVRAACRRLKERFGRKLRKVLVQPMIRGGTEMIVGVADDLNGMQCVTSDASGQIKVHLTVTKGPFGASNIVCGPAQACLISVTQATPSPTQEADTPITFGLPGHARRDDDQPGPDRDPCRVPGRTGTRIRVAAANAEEPATSSSAALLHERHDRERQGRTARRGMTYAPGCTAAPRRKGDKHRSVADEQTGTADGGLVAGRAVGPGGRDPCCRGVPRR